MDGTEEIPNLESVCRLCLASDVVKSPIFETPNAALCLADKIQAYLSIQISANDRISTFICCNCSNKINKWHTYREICQRSQEKLQQWLSKQLCNQTIQIKDEPVDFDYVDNIEILTEQDDRNLVETHAVNIEANSSLQSDNNHALDKESEENTLSARQAQADDVVLLRENNRIERSSLEEDIKVEPLSDDDADSLMDLESSAIDLVPNPMAKAKEDRIMEADSTQKFHVTGFKVKRKNRRISKTHFHGKKGYKRKCVHCLIYLHSKTSYVKHMERFHSYPNNIAVETKPKSLNKIVLSPSKTIKKSKSLLPVRMSARIAEAASQQLESENDTMDETNDDQDKCMDLTPMQVNIISQLKTFSCYSCQEYFADRRSTLNHIRQHVPDLRPYTCIACLTAFDDRSLYKLHCSDSYDCAMKIALVVPKFGTEKYFTCNMCLESLPNRPDLLSHLTLHVDKSNDMENSIDQNASLQSVKHPTFAPTEVPSPYMGGNPIHNHECDLCGMIYKHKINMQKHRDHCASLPLHSRNSYRCVFCGMTFLVYKKFQSHLTTDHKRKDMTCHLCGHTAYSSNEYLSHHETHRAMQEDEPANDSLSELEDGTTKALKCALCGEICKTLTEHAEHRNLHLKVKIYSCVICRNMFSSAAALELHMRDHGILETEQQNAHHSFDENGSGSNDNGEINESSMSDLGGRLPTCPECGNTFASTNNVARHLKNVHRVDRSICNHCYEVFMNKEQLENHIKKVHIVKLPGQKTPTQRPVLKCPQCSKIYTYESALHHHCQNVHGFNYEDRKQGQKPAFYKCEICTKTFKEEFSMRIHKTWHYRADSRLARGIPNSKLSPVKNTDSGSLAPVANSPKPAKARKSFPNPPKFSSIQKYQSIQCQVCDGRFDDVAELRKHLWEVHCARNKQEKPFIINELQCELCTTIFPDRPSLDAHMAWHRANPILSNCLAPQITMREESPDSPPSPSPPPPPPAPTHTFTCGTCGKVCSSKKMLYKHKRIHKIPNITGSKMQAMPLKKMVVCSTCGKAFSTTGNLAKHRAMTGCGMNYNVKMKKETGQSEHDIPKKKPVHCLLCKATFPNMRVLYQHKQIMHSKAKPIVKTSGPVPSLVPLADNNGGVICNICGKRFTGIPPLKQHYTIKHKKTSLNKTKVQKNLKNGPLTCMSKNCRQAFPNQESLKQHELENHSNILYSCQMCERHFFDKSIIVKHVLNTHKAAYQVGVSNASDFFEEVDLNTYDIKDLANPRECPLCHVRYPNTKALKIHYYKIHDKGY